MPPAKVRPAFSPRRLCNTLLAVVAWAACSLTSFSAQAADLHTLHGHLPSVLKKLKAVGRPNKTEHLRLALSLPVRNTDALTQLLKNLYDPASPQYRQFLTPAQFTAQFGPTAADYDSAISVAKAQGLKVSATHSNRMVLDVEGTVADIEQAFHVTLQTYDHPTEHRQFFAPDREPSVDATWPIFYVSGLDSYSLPQPNFQIRPAELAEANTSPSTGSAPGGAFGGNDFRAAYVPGTSLTGAGQSVALLEFDAYYAADITAYQTQFSLPSVPLVNIAVDGGVASPGANNTEVALDIEMVMCLAPGLSHIYVYEAPPGAPWVDILNKIATDNLAKQVSCSWFITNGEAKPAAEAIFQQMAAQGQSFFAASGDSDAYAGLISFPSDSPNITTVGGTTLTTSGPGGSYVSESTWNWGFRNHAYQGSGGGVSTNYAIPSWQQGLNMTANLGSTTLRNVPDVALTADNIWVNSNNGGTTTLGGTSAAAPLWAAFTALANQQAAVNGQPSIGFLNPTLYNIAQGSGYSSAFHDVTAGNNFSASSPSNFPAVTGYDLCTGLGTPLGSGLINALAESLRITGSDLTSSGAPGGSFTPISVSYQLKNSGLTSLSWSASSQQSWLSVSPPSGTLAAGATTTLTVSLNSTAANSLGVGTYTGAISIVDTTSGVLQSRTATLSVLGAPSLSVSPTAGFASLGFAGGPFTPSSAAYTLTNRGTPSLNWTASKSSTWLTLSGSSGTLAPGASTTVTASVNSAANALATGSYSDTIQFTNATNGSGNTSAGVSLRVSTQPQFQLSMPTQSSTLNGDARGFWFVAPSSFSIIGLQVPTDASTSSQSIAVVRFSALPPTFPTTTAGFTTLFLTQKNSNSGIISTNIPIAQGDIIGVLGCRAEISSLGVAPFSTTILGSPVTFKTLGMSFPLDTTAPQQLWTNSTPTLSRVSLLVSSTTPEPILNSATTATGEQGQPFSYQITALNNPTAYASANLIPGLTLNPATGLISGTITAAPGSYTISLQASNAAGIGTGSLTLAVKTPMTISPSPLAGATVNTLYHQTATVTGGLTPYTSLTVTNFSDGGTGLTSSAITTNASAGTFTLNGTPTAAGAAIFTVNVTDSLGGVIASNQSLIVNPAMSLSPASPPPATSNTPYHQVITIRGGTAPYASLSVPLFNGGATGLTATCVSMDSTAGTFTIDGTPTSTGSAFFVAKVTDAAGANFTQVCVLSVIGPAPNAPVLQSMPLFVAGTSNTVHWSAVSGATSYTVQLATTPDFSTPLSTQTVTTTSATFSGLTLGTLYYYRATSNIPAPAPAQGWAEDSQADFANGATSNTTVLPTGNVTLTYGLGAQITGRIADAGFESQLTGWTQTSSTGMGAETMSNTSFPPFPTEGTNFGNLFTNASGGFAVGATSSLTQSISFTNIGAIVFDASLISDGNGHNTTANVLIDGTALWTQTTVGTSLNQVVVSPFSSGTHTLELRATTTTNAAGSEWLLFDNLRTYRAGTGYTSGTFVSPTIAPTPLAAWSNLYFDDTLPSGTSFTVDVLDGSGTLLASNIASGANLANVPAVASAPAIKLRANLSSTNSSVTPALQDWMVVWNTATASTVSSGWSNVVSATQGIPQIAVQQPAGTNLTNGAQVDYGTDLAGVATPLTYTVQNTGTANLTLSNAAVTGTNAADFILTTPPGTTTLASGQATTLVITFTASITSPETATLQLASNDPTTPTFALTLKGTGTTTFNSTFTAPTENELSVSGFKASGLTLGTVTLDFSPTPGQVLTLVNNTGASSIVGSFTGLPEGALVDVLFGGTTYHFVISYLGGDGNDITLTLPQTVPTSPRLKGSTGFRKVTPH